VNTRKLGLALIVAGVIVWVVYGAVRVLGWYDGPVMPFLAVHLLFVIPGSFVAGRGWTKRLVEMIGGGRPDDARNG
jgi:hypothetical protein